MSVRQSAPCCSFEDNCVSFFWLVLEFFSFRSFSDNTLKMLIFLISWGVYAQLILFGVCSVSITFLMSFFSCFLQIVILSSPSPLHIFLVDGSYTLVAASHCLLSVVSMLLSLRVPVWVFPSAESFSSLVPPGRRCSVWRPSWADPPSAGRTPGIG